MPIAVTNSISKKRDRPSCDSLDNKLWPWEDLDTKSANEVGVLFAPGSATKVDKGDFADNDNDGGNGDDDGKDNVSAIQARTLDAFADHDNQDKSGDGLGDGKDRAGPENGLGEGAAVHSEPRWVAALFCGAVLPMLLPYLP